MDGDKKRLFRIWRVLHLLVGWVLKGIFGYTCELAQPGVGPFLLVCNHNTDLDPALVGLSFPKDPLRFVASEHTLRKGLASRLLQYCFHPISRIKGATDAAAAMDVIRALRRGDSVCIFAEGNRSFNGLTGPIFPATGKLVKVAGTALITYKLEGGYLTSPRWGKGLRRGRMLGYCVNVYAPEQLKAMTPDEVNAAIAQDLAEDAFARQEGEAQPIPYRGKRLAEGLEKALYLCPKCGRIGTLRGADDQFSCACGLTVTYTPYGFFAGTDAPFSNIRDWDAWQSERMMALAAALGEAPAFSDSDMTLYEICEDHSAREIARGDLAMGRHKMTLGERAFPLGEISGMALVGSAALVFTWGGKHYEIKSTLPRCGRKYLTLYQCLKAHSL